MQISAESREFSFFCYYPIILPLRLNAAGSRKQNSAEEYIACMYRFRLQPVGYPCAFAGHESERERGKKREVRVEASGTSQLRICFQAVLFSPVDHPSAIQRETRKEWYQVVKCSCELTIAWFSLRATLSATGWLYKSRHDTVMWALARFAMHSRGQQP